MDEFVTLIREHASETLRDEPGTLRFDVIQDETTANHFYVDETYVDEAAFQTHMHGPIGKRNFPRIRALVSGELDNSIARDGASAGMCLRDMADGALATQGRWHTWIHPETGRPIRQRVDGQVDFNNQLILDRCLIEYDDESVEFPMRGRWIFKEEFVLLLRLAGFADWACFSTPEGNLLDLGPQSQQSYWSIEKR